MNREELNCELRKIARNIADDPTTTYEWAAADMLEADVDAESVVRCMNCTAAYLPDNSEVLYCVERQDWVADMGYCSDGTAKNGGDA